jgi:hypothetical protein
VHILFFQVNAKSSQENSHLSKLPSPIYQT